jgi:S1-C subfamily serine protease
MFVTDCYLTGGDSGGPFFDLDGRLIGIPHANSAPARLHDAFLILGDADTATPDRRTVDRVGPFSAVSSHLIRQHLEAMLGRKVHVFDQSTGERFHNSFKDARETLPRPQWTQGDETAQPFHAIVRGSLESVVTILDENDRRVAFGTIVDPDGSVVTVASALPAFPKCQLSGGLAVTAEVIGTNHDYDVALLKIPAANLRAVEWAGQPPTVAGALVAAVGVTDAPLGIGVVSVPNTPSDGAPSSDSKPYADYSTFFEIDVPIDKPRSTSQCGGPVVNLDGKAIGIISKYREYGCTALPAGQIKRIMSELKSQQGDR